MSDTEIQSDTPTEVAPAEEEQPTPEAADPAQAEQPEESEGNAEAAKFRKRLRETEAERDRLRDQVTALQRQQIEARVASAGVRPAALWAVTQLADLLTEDGAIDDTKIDTAVQTARDQLGVPVIGKGTVVPGVGNVPNLANLKPTDDWRNAFSAKRR